MEKAKTFFAILGLGITIGVVLVVFLIFLVGARPKNVNVGGVEFEIPTSTPIPPSNNPVSQPPTESSNTGSSQNSSSFIASSPLVINGTSYSVPTSNSPFCVASQQTGYTSSGVDYDLVVPKGWVIVWDSWKAYWSGGKYENDGLLIVYGNWQGKVTIVNGEYCATLVEWKDFAINLRANAVAKPSRPQFSIGETP